MALAHRTRRIAAAVATVVGRASGNPGRSALGFSLLEMVVVVALISVLMGLSMPLLTVFDQRAREAALAETLIDTRKAIDRYRENRNASGSPLPPSLASLTEMIPADLVKDGGDAGPFLVDLPLNPAMGQFGAFYWHLRAGNGNWVYHVTSGAATLPGGVFDIGYASPPSGLFVRSVDGSFYADW